MIHLLATIGQKADRCGSMARHNMAWHGTAQHHALSAQCSAAQNAVSMPSAQCSAAQDGQRGTTWQCHSTACTQLLAQAHTDDVVQLHLLNCLRCIVDGKQYLATHKAELLG